MNTVTKTPTIPEIAALIRDAIEQTPPRRHRRIWLTDGMILDQVDGSDYADMGEATELLSLVPGSKISDGWIICPPGSLRSTLDIGVGIAIRHGWTLVDGYPTATEARLWRAA